MFDNLQETNSCNVIFVLTLTTTTWNENDDVTTTFQIFGEWEECISIAWHSIGLCCWLFQLMWLNSMSYKSHAAVFIIADNVNMHDDYVRDMSSKWMISSVRVSFLREKKLNREMCSSACTEVNCLSGFIVENSKWYFCAILCNRHACVKSGLQMTTGRVLDSCIYTIFKLHLSAVSKSIYSPLFTALFFSKSKKKKEKNGFQFCRFQTCYLSARVNSLPMSCGCVFAFSLLSCSTNWV